MQTVYIRKEQKKDYTVISNSIITDKRLSAEARATHIYLLSRPPQWKAWNKDIQTVMGFGRNKYLRIMKELRDAGYQSLKKGGEGGGNVLTIYDVSGSPETRLSQNATIAKEDHIVSTDKSSNNLLVYISARGIETEYENFKQMRKQKKKPMNATAEKLLLRELEKNESAGHQPADLLEMATANCWLSIYPPKENNNGHKGHHGQGQTTVQTPLDRCNEAIRKMDAEALAEDDSLVW